MTIRTTLAIAALGFTTLLAGGAQAKASDYCREYTRTIFVGGIQQQAYGTACLEPDGAWRVSDESLNNRYGDGYQDGGYIQNSQNVSYVIYDGPRVIHQPRIRYVRYYTAPPVVYRQPSFRFSYYDNDRHGGNWNRGRGHDRNDDRGRNGNHDRDRGDHDRWNRHH